MNRLTILLGKLANLAGIPGIVRECDYRSQHGVSVTVRRSDLYTVITVNGVNVYFYRLTGGIDGIGFVQHGSVTQRIEFPGPNGEVAGSTPAAPANHFGDAIAAATPGPWAWADWSEDDGPNTNTLQSPPETRPGGPSKWFPNLANGILRDEESECLPVDKAFIAQSRTDLPAVVKLAREQQRQLHGWNVAASEVCPGSEFVDDPKRVFAHVRTRLETARRFALENAALKLRLEAAEKDTARLDWMDTVSFMAYRSRDPETHKLHDHAVVVNEDRPGWRIGEVLASIRDTIDAARAPEPNND